MRGRAAVPGHPGRTFPDDVVSLGVHTPSRPSRIERSPHRLTGTQGCPGLLGRRGVSGRRSVRAASPLAGRRRSLRRSSTPWGISSVGLAVTGGVPSLPTEILPPQRSLVDAGPDRTTSAGAGAREPSWIRANPRPPECGSLGIEAPQPAGPAKPGSSFEPTPLEKLERCGRAHTRPIPRRPAGGRVRHRTRSRPRRGLQAPEEFQEPGLDALGQVHEVVAGRQPLAVVGEDRVR